MATACVVSRTSLAQHRPSPSPRMPLLPVVDEELRRATRAARSAGVGRRGDQEFDQMPADQRADVRMAERRCRLPRTGGRPRTESAKTHGARVVTLSRLVVDGRRRHSRRRRQQASRKAARLTAAAGAHQVAVSQLCLPSICLAEPRCACQERAIIGFAARAGRPPLVRGSLASAWCWADWHPRGLQYHDGCGSVGRANGNWYRGMPCCRRRRPCSRGVVGGKSR